MLTLGKPRYMCIPFLEAVKSMAVWSHLQHMGGWRVVCKFFEIIRLLPKISAVVCSQIQRDIFLLIKGHFVVWHCCLSPIHDAESENKAALFITVFDLTVSLTVKVTIGVVCIK